MWAALSGIPGWGWAVGGVAYLAVKLVDESRNDNDTDISTHEGKVGPLLGTALVLASAGYVLHQGTKLLK